MISFTDTESQQILRQTVREFVANTIAPQDRGWDESSGPLPHLGDELGLYGLCTESGLSFADAVVVLQELGFGSGSFAFVIAVHNFADEKTNRSSDRLGCRAADVSPANQSARFQVACAAIALGRARMALQAATNYAKERQQFGRALADNQAIQFMLADGATRLDAAELMIARAAISETETTATMAKQFSIRAAIATCDQALQIFGGAGYTREVPVERALRDCKFLERDFGSAHV